MTGLFRALRRLMPMAILPLALAGTSVVGTSAQAAEPYHVGAWYFLGWNANNAGSLRRQSTQQYGDQDTWGGVREYATGKGAFQLPAAPGGKPPDFSARVPYLGYYDEMQPAVVDSQIKTAAAKGIDFFAFYWFLDMATGAEEPFDAPLKQFFASRAAPGFKMLLAPLAVGGTAEHRRMSLQAWTSAVVPKLAAYAAEPSYFRLNGRPVVVDFAIPFEKPDDRRAAYQALREAIHARTGAQPIVLQMLQGRSTSKDVAFQKKSAGADGFTCFNVGTIKPAEREAELAAEWRRITAAQIGPATPERKSMIYVPCATTGVDARPWFNVGWGMGGAKDQITGRPYISDPDAKAFQAHLQDVRAFIDSGDVNTLRTTIIYSWNEWGEAAAVLEPSKTAGASYLDAVGAVFGKP